MKKLLLFVCIFNLGALHLFAYSDNALTTITVRGKYEGTEIEEFYENGQLVRRKITIQCWSAVNETCYTMSLTGTNRIQLEDGNGNFIGEGEVISADEYNHIYQLGN